MYEIEKSVSKNRETLHERFSGSIGNDFIPHMNCWNSISHFKTLPTFVMDRVPYGNFNLQANENHSVKLYAYESARNSSLSFSLCGYQAPEDDFFSVHIRIAGDWTGEVEIAVIAVAPTGKASFVYSYVQTRPKGQYNGKWPFSLFYVLKPLITPIRAITRESLELALPSSSVTRNVILVDDQTISFPESSGLLVSVWTPGETLG